MKWHDCNMTPSVQDLLCLFLQSCFWISLSPLSSTYVCLIVTVCSWHTVIVHFCVTMVTGEAASGQDDNEYSWTYPAFHASTEKYHLANVCIFFLSSSFRIFLFLLLFRLYPPPPSVSFRIVLFFCLSLCKVFLSVSCVLFSAMFSSFIIMSTA